MRFIIPRLQDLDRSARILSSQSDSPSWRRRAATYDLLEILNETAELGTQWCPQLPALDRHNWPSLVGNPDEDRWFIFNLGDRIHNSLLQEGLLWPPPVDRPPPAITRDLQELFDTPHFHSSDEEALSSLTSLFDRIRNKSTELMASLDNSDAAPQVVQAVSGLAYRRPNRVSGFLTGLALVIGLIQEPGAIHHLPSDISDLGGDVVQVEKVITSGVFEAGSWINHVISQGPGLPQWPT